MLMLAGRAADEKEARALMEGVIQDGSALDKFAQFVRAQGGDAAPVYDTSLLPVAGKTLEVTAKESGYVHRILAEDIGIACMTLGGGRETKESAIDLSVGIILEKKNGNAVSAGEVLATIYGNDDAKMQAAYEKIAHAYEIAKEPAAFVPVVREYIFPE